MTKNLCFDNDLTDTMKRMDRITETFEELGIEHKAVLREFKE